MDKTMSLTENIEYYLSKVTVSSKQEIDRAITFLLKEYYFLESEEADDKDCPEFKTPLYYGKRVRFPLFRNTDAVDCCDVIIQIVDP